jgi:hypothetical protein
MTWVAAGLTAAEIAAMEAAAIAAAEAAAVAAAETAAANAAAAAAAEVAAAEAAATAAAETAATTAAETAAAETIPGSILEASAVPPPPAQPATPAGLEQIGQGAQPMPPAGSTPPPTPEPAGIQTASGPATSDMGSFSQDQQLIDMVKNARPDQMIPNNPLPSGFEATPPAPVPDASAADVINKAIEPSTNPFLDGAKDTLKWMDQNPFKTGAIGYLGLQATGALNQKPQQVSPQKSTFKNPYYFSDKFQGSNPDPNVYKPSYAGYAAGGITQASVPTPGLMDGSQAANVNFMGKDMYPMSQQSSAHYATPTQMPTSAQQSMANYESNTNPLTGEISMAQGGQVPGYELGGIIERLLAQAPKGSFNSRYSYDQDSGKYTKLAQGGIARYYRGELATSTGGRGDVYGATQRFLDMYDPQSKYNPPTEKGDPGIFRDTNPSTRDRLAPDAGRIRQEAIAKRTQVNTRAKPLKPSVRMGEINLKPQGAEREEDNSDSVLNAARGGIMQAGLGSYAAGGNPRLLKGPGDGMSDNIPATIGGKQPARLADGEFVVPADVVSHLGNGSTDAGAKKLHGMMDKVRMDRTGKKKQAPAVKAKKYLPK